MHCFIPLLALSAAITARQTDESPACPFDASRYPDSAHILVADARLCTTGTSTTPPFPVCIVGAACDSPKLLSRNKDRTGFDIDGEDVDGLGPMTDFPSNLYLNVRNCRASRLALRDFLPPANIPSTTFFNCPFAVDEFNTIPWPSLSLPFSLKFEAMDLVNHNTSLIMPPALQNMELANCSFAFNRVVWPSQSIKKLALHNARLSDNPPYQYPPSVQALYINASGLMDFANPPPLLRILDLRSNRLTRFENLSLTDLQDITLDYNPNLTSVRNVTFSRRLTGLYIILVLGETWSLNVDISTAIDAPISQFHLTKGTWDALNSLDAHDAFSTISEGYIASMRWTDDSKRACDAVRGVATTLHNSTVCVVSDNSGATDLNVSLIALGSTASILVVVAAVCHWRWRRRAAAVTSPMKDTWEMTT
ncbi:Aste57867_24733 [Aphanomyces stellatus]|uniref:Aste57867_24733 protein n=1 Tax=Aphanomyces stellatus TaxID=120398 RepID=A0A485LR98_9STRA|nr:hypothetical protein As57867_024655 [Aphanomyces stellatus]VFU01369.1 Aste57867_24733 [Aphanomyces stellatus]